MRARPPVTPEHREIALALAEKHLRPIENPFGAQELPLIHVDSAEFKSLKTKTHRQVLGLDPKTTALAALISLLSPAQIAGFFGGMEACVQAGIELKNGACLLYGLETAALREDDADAAEALMAAALRMRILFQYDHELPEVAGPERTEAVLAKLLESWRPEKDLPVWYLLEYHRNWSPELSRKMIQAVAESSAAPRHVMWEWRGIGFADNMHPDLVEEAAATLKAMAKIRPDAKRLLARIKKRMKG